MKRRLYLGMLVIMLLSACAVRQEEIAQVKETNAAAEREQPTPAPQISQQQREPEPLSAFQQGIAARLNGGYEQAIAIFSGVIADDPAHAGAYWQRALVYADREQYDLAIADLQRVVELEPDFADAHGLLGWYLLQQGRFQEAKAPCHAAHDLQPDFLRWTMNMGHVHLLTGDAKTARTYYQKAVAQMQSPGQLQAGLIAELEFFIEQDWQPTACHHELNSITLDIVHKQESLFSLYAARALEQVAEITIFPALLESFHGEDPILRRNAAILLEQLAPSRVVKKELSKALIGILQESNATVRMYAIEALTTIQETSAVPALIALLHDQRTVIRMSAAWALGKFADARAVPELLKTLQEDTAMEVRYWAAKALAEIDTTSPVFDQSAILTLLRGLGKEAFVKIESDGDVRVRSYDTGAFVDILGNLSRHTSVFLDALTHEQADVRETVAMLLGDIGDDAALPALVEALNDPDRDVRQNVVEALGKLGGAKMAPILVDMLDDPDYNVYKETLFALVNIGDTSACSALRSTMQDPSSEVRNLTVNAVGFLGCTQAVPALLDALNDQHALIRRNAALALGQIGNCSMCSAL